MATPASGLASTAKFGAELNPTVQPSNSLPAHFCDEQDHSKSCTRVSMEAYGRPDGGEKAPHDGVIKRIRVIAGGPGQFRLQIAKTRKVGSNDYQAKVVRNGPTIHYQGQSQQNWDNDNYNVESFQVDVPIKKGQYLAMRSKSTSLVRCSSGGDNNLIFTPPLLSGGGFENPTEGDGCWLLMEAVVKY